MTPERQRQLNTWLERHTFLTGQAMEFCKDKEEATYLVSSLMQDYVRKFQFAVSHFVSTEETKAAMKMSLDCVLMDYGLVTAYIPRANQ